MVVVAVTMDERGCGIGNGDSDIRPVGGAAINSCRSRNYGAERANTAAILVARLLCSLLMRGPRRRSIKRQCA
jgi:hypothetical protein